MVKNNKYKNKNQFLHPKHESPFAILKKFGV